MFKIPQNLKGLTVNLAQGLFKQCSHFQLFSFFVEGNLMDSSSYYGINYKITNLDFF